MDSYASPSQNSSRPEGPLDEKGNSSSRLLEWALPILLHRLANQTQWITGFRSVMAMGGGDDWLRSKGPDLGHAGRQLQDIGWLLAVLGSAQGANLLLTRRDPRGLALMVDLVAEGLQKDRRTPIPKPPTIPLLKPAGLDGWQVAYGVGELVWSAYQESAQGGLGERAWDLRLGPNGNWLLELPLSDPVRKTADWVRELLPGAKWSETNNLGTLEMPSEWLAPS